MSLWWLCCYQNCWGAHLGCSEISHMLLSLRLCLVTHFPLLIGTGHSCGNVWSVGAPLLPVLPLFLLPSVF